MHIIKTRIKVIYIGGVEHNGSTFLGVILGNHHKIESVGELTSLAREGWLGSHMCACGLKIEECKFWDGVRGEWEKMVDDDISTLARLEDAYDRHRRLPKVLMEKYIRSNNFTIYSHYSYSLFKAIEITSGNSIIVDTSKRYSRAMALSMIDNVDLYLIHLVRDSRGVAYSWSKPKRPVQRTWLDASFRWNTTNYSFELAKRFLDKDKIMFLRYEDLIQNPFKTLMMIGNFIDLDLSNLAMSVSNGDYLKTNHIGVGNGFLRQKSKVKLVTDITWPNKAPIEIQRKVWKFTGRLMRRYGYSS